MSQIHQVLYDFEAEEEGEMSVRVGDVVKLLPQSEGPDGDDDDRNGWVFVKATRTGQRGYVPLDYIEPTQSTHTPTHTLTHTSTPSHTPSHSVSAMKSPQGVSAHSQSQGQGQGQYKHHTPSGVTQTHSHTHSHSSGTPQHQHHSQRDSSPQEQSHTHTHTGTPEVGKRLSLAALVNPPPPKTSPQEHTHTQSLQPPARSTSPDTGPNILPPPPAPLNLEPSTDDEPKHYGMDKKPFGMDTPEEVYPKHSPKKSKGHGGHSLASSMAKSLGASSASKSKTGGMSKFKKSASMVQNMVRVSSAVAAPRVPSLASAVDREDWDELTKRNDEYFARLVSSQAETFDSLTDMVDALSKKLNDATKSSHDLVSKLSELDELIDEEKRKWKSQNEAEKNAEVLGRSKQLMSSVEDGPGSRSGLGRSFSPRGQ